MPEIVSNTSPLQYLPQLGLLSLLPRMVGRVLIPPGVEAELEAGRRLGIDVAAREQAGAGAVVEGKMASPVPCD